MRLNLQIARATGTEATTLDVDHLVIAGWAGRDRAAMEHHIAELEALGIARPKSTPTFYRVAAARLTTAPRIECSGDRSSGEAETVILAHRGELLVGLGSDHTDREVEAYGVTVSKQMCDKPLGGTLWPLAEVAGHWDRLILRAWLTEGGVRRLYQEGAVSGLLPPDTLIAQYADGAGLPEGAAMFGGTMPAIGGIRAGTRFEAELEDPVRGRRLSLAYDIAALPIAG
jgi:hypothetical protein